MTLTKRIIPCLDVKNGRVVKGLNFESIKDAGDPVELAAKYSHEGADELVFLDITASDEQRETIKELVRKVASVINIPFTVGGGVKSVDDARNILLNGADKVGVNTAAIKNPTLITELMTLFGRQCVVVAIDAKRNYEKLGYSTEDIEIHLLKFYTYPFYLTIMTVFSCIIMMNIKYNKPKVFHIILGIMISVIIYYINLFSSVMGQSLDISSKISSLFPLIIISLTCCIGLIKINEK